MVQPQLVKIGGPWTRSIKGGPWAWFIFWWTWSINPVHGGGPWTRGPCFVLSLKKIQGNVLLLHWKDMQKFRHFWRKKISWKSHLGQSCTKTFNYCLAVQPWLTLFRHISLSVLMVCSVPCIARYWLQISYGTRGGENWNRDSGLFLYTLNNTL